MKNGTLSPQAPLPILIELNKYALVTSGFLAYVAEHFDVDLAALTRRVKDTSSPVLLMLDGLDEILNNDARQRVLQEIQEFSRQYPGNHIKIVVTSRIVGYNPTELATCGYGHYVAQPLSPAQIKGFVEKWHEVTYGPLLTDICAQRVDRLMYAIHKYRTLEELADSPIMLTMLAILNRGPTMPYNRCDLLHQCSKFLIYRWANDNFVRQRTGKDAYKHARLVSQSEKTVMLYTLAWEIQRDGGALTTLATRETLEKVIGSVVPSRTDEARATEELIKFVEEHHSVLCYVGDNWFGFVHRSFLEYFCALAIYWRSLERKITPESLVTLYRTRGSDPSWAEVLHLASGMLPTIHVAPCLDVLLGMNKLVLAMRCIQQLKARGLAADAVKRVRQAVTSVLISGREEADVDVDLVPCFVSCWPCKDPDTGWSYPETRPTLEVAARSPVKWLANSAILAMAENWADETTRAVFVDVVQSDKTGAEAAVIQLVEKWPNESTHAPCWWSGAVRQERRRGCCDAAGKGVGG